ncbi:hypothetical protein MKX01_026103 [Papaver californicum]|nr:hypothetical protein MKX01_026103 [Papaver californicum]
MENLSLVSSPKILLGSSSSPNLGCPISLKHSSFSLFHRRNASYQTRCKITARAHHRFSDKIRLPITKSENVTEVFASISSSSTSKETSSSVGVTPQLVPPPSSQIGSPLFWIGVGVGFSALFSWASSNLKKYAMQQAMKTLTGQMSRGNSPLNNSAFSQESPFPFPFPMPPPPTSGTSATPAASPPSRPRVTVDVSATNVEAAPHSSPAEVKRETEIKKEQQKYAFEDVSPQEVLQEDLFTSSKKSSEQTPTKNAQFFEEVSHNGAASKQDESYYKETAQSSGTGKSPMSVDSLEKMMEDPTVQKMVYPYLPEQMRNPETFKWMLQNPEYRQQLGDMLNNMGGGTEWDNRMMDSLKNFDLSSPEVKEQFDQIGLTPEDVIAKIMANPDVAMAFQNPRVQQAIMDCSQNPLSIAKYQNDKEVMDVFNKISELFPGVGSP